MKKAITLTNCRIQINRKRLGNKKRRICVCGLGEALRCFSREVEHSDENLERLEEGFCFDERLSAERFFIGLK